MSEINFPFGVTEMLKAWQKGILRPQQRLLKFKGKNSTEGTTA